VHSPAWGVNVCWTMPPSIGAADYGDCIESGGVCRSTAVPFGQWWVIMPVFESSSC